MANERYILVRPPQLPELANIQAGAYVVGYNTATDQTVKINVSALGGGQETDINWRANVTYATGNIVEYGLKLWKSLIDDNLGNLPTEGANWTEVSKAGAGSNITNYTTGVYTYDPTIVLRGGRIYYLLAEKPFESVDFIAELEANQWTAVNRNNLIGVDTQGNDYFFPFLGDTVIVLYATSIGIENGEETVFNLTVPQPSYVVRTGAGYTPGDFTIIALGSGGGGGGHTFEDSTDTVLPTRSVAKAGPGIEFEDDADGEKTVVRVSKNLTDHIDGADEEKHTTNQIIQQLELLKLNLPANSPLHTILQSIDNFLAGTLNVDEIDDAGWAISERRLAILENTINGIQIQGAAQLLDIFAPPGVEASLRDNSGWVNETKTLTGDNSTGQLGQKGAMIWLNDAVYAQCTSAVLDVSGSATYKRNRAVDVLDPANNTQDAAIANELDPSYTYPPMTPTGNSTDDGWNLTSQVKIITGKPTRWGMWFIGGINGDGYTYHCFLVNGTTSYWKRTGTPSSISRCIYAATHPNLTTNLLAHDFGTGPYTQVPGDEVTYADQTFYDATTRSYFIKMINGNWEKIR